MAYIDDTSCEAFDGLGVQLLVTGQTDLLVKLATTNFTALPSVIFGGSEAGFVREVSQTKTPDKRPGALCQLWVGGTGEKAGLKLYRQLGFRVRQALLTTPTIAVFNALESDDIFDVTENIGHYGDGFETVGQHHGRTCISIPLMMGHDFVIEQKFAYKPGVMGGFLWLYCDTVGHALAIGEKALQVVRDQGDVSTIFGVCPSGSKLQGINYPAYGPTTNHILCPSLRGTIPDSGVPEGVGAIPEIVVNTFDLETLKIALKTIILAIQDEEGLLRISSGNFGNQLGQYSIPLNTL
ncbi:MAG TPA: formylmethanofuran--tetrahydromethanopterin formyltransferase [Candidatus Lokiarchaeia archaeon]|nr:formylmethanofuran--tetrahydromethanopterin formyltransferase [Candidatus Lokiarchaeia archaeon]